LASLVSVAMMPSLGAPISALAPLPLPAVSQQTSNASKAPKTAKEGYASGAVGTGSTRGAKLFERDCARCHGANGDGNSRIRGTLHPQPLDLTSFQISNAYALQVLHNGVPGSDMPAWHVSPEKDLRDEAAYTSHLAKPVVLSEQDRYAPPDALVEAGKRVYDAHCERCHGMSGNGDGPDARKYRPRPASFAGMRPSFEGAQHVIQNGVAGTAMPSWPLLTPPEIQAVTFYVRTFYNDGTASRSSTAATSARTGAQP